MIELLKERVKGTPLEPTVKEALADAVELIEIFHRSCLAEVSVDALGIDLGMADPVSDEVSDAEFCCEYLADEESSDRALLTAVWINLGVATMGEIALLLFAAGTAADYQLLNCMCQHLVQDIRRAIEEKGPKESEKIKTTLFIVTLDKMSQEGPIGVRQLVLYHYSRVIASIFKNDD